ncbi:hypothetical protein Taro_010839, partial [Colocasia esculenta]|nr:hypothetical protein [Colocasia esculenta]
VWDGGACVVRLWSHVVAPVFHELFVSAGACRYLLPHSLEFLLLWQVVARALGSLEGVWEVGVIIVVASFPSGSERELQESVAAVAGCSCYECGHLSASLLELSRCFVCCVAPLVERCNTCLWLLSALCWLVVNSGEVLPEFFFIGSGGKLFVVLLLGWTVACSLLVYLWSRPVACLLPLLFVGRSGWWCSAMAFGAVLRTLVTIVAKVSCGEFFLLACVVLTAGATFWCIVLYLGWLPVLVIASCIVPCALIVALSVVRQALVVACVWVFPLAWERVCSVVVLCLGLGPSEVDVLFSTSAVVSFPVQFANVLGFLALPTSNVFSGFVSARCACGAVGLVFHGSTIVVCPCRTTRMIWALAVASCAGQFSGVLCFSCFLVGLVRASLVEFSTPDCVLIASWCALCFEHAEVLACSWRSVGAVWTQEKACRWCSLFYGGLVLVVCGRGEVAFLGDHGLVPIRGLGFYLRSRQVSCRDTSQKATCNLSHSDGDSVARCDTCLCLPYLVEVCDGGACVVRLWPHVVAPVFSELFVSAGAC